MSSYPTYRSLTRRTFGRGALAIGGATLVPSELWGQGARLANDARLSTYLKRSEYLEPGARKSVGGRLETSLTVAYANNQIGSETVRLRSYEGALVGPTLRVKPGDKLVIQLKNKLPWVGGNAHAGMAHSDFNATNLHTHGLHVSPQGASDNVLITILPEGAPASAARDELTKIGAFTFTYDLPASHLPGTHWYHAHLHGSTAIQLASGMAGALIVEGDIDEVPEIKAAKERVFVFQQIPYDDSKPGQIESEDLKHLDAWFNNGRFTTLNGTVPIIRMQEGALERWRLIHGGIFEDLEIDAVGCPKPFDENAASLSDFCKDAATSAASDGVSFYPIASDGITLGTLDHIKAEALPRLVPGNRLDLLVQPLAAGTYILRKRAPTLQNTMNVALKLARFQRAGASEADAVKLVRTDPYALAVMIVEPSRGEAPMPLPSAAAMKALKRPSPIAASSAPTASHKLTLELKDSILNPPPVGYVNNRTFDSAMFPRTLRLNATERWEINSLGDVHPFHIHVNPFLMIERNGKPITPIWGDTIKAATNETVAFLTRYENFLGKFVLHCHNLMHEDWGMMELVEIVPDPQGTLKDIRYYQHDQVPVTAWTFSDENGSSIGKEQFAGRVALLYLWSTACGSCADDLKRLSQLQGKLETSKFEVAAVNQGEDAASARAFLRSQGISNLGIFIDPAKSMSSLFGFKTMPAAILIDRAGHARASLQQPAEWDGTDALDLIRYFTTA